MRLLISIPVLAAAAALSGCGGSDDSADSVTGIYINPELKGISSEPKLVELEAGNTGVIPLNSRVEGGINGGSSASFIYTTKSSGKVLLYLNSLYKNLNGRTNDLDLVVDGPNDNKSSRNTGSEEFLILTVEEGQVYNITVDAQFSGNNEYVLKLVTPNKETLDLHDDQYLILMNNSITSDCESVNFHIYSDGNGHIVKYPTFTSSDEYSLSYFVVVNWASGYLRYGDEQVAFTDYNDLTITVSYSEQEEDESFISSGSSVEGVLTMTVDPDTGVVSGNDSWSNTDFSAFTSTSCDTYESINGQILL